MKKIYFILTILTVFLAFSCNDNTGGLFYSIEQESAIANGTLDDDLTLGAMSKYGEYYFIAAGDFMYKKISATAEVEWTEENPEINEDSLLCQNFIINGSNAYAVFYNTAATVFAVYRTSIAQPADISWAAINFSDLSTETILDIEQSGDFVFLYSKNSEGKYSIHTAAATGFSESSSITTIVAGMTASGDLAVDYDGTDYWIASGNKVFRSDGTAAANDVTPSYSAFEGLNGDGFRGIVCVDTDTAASGTEIYLSSREGLLLERKSGSWGVINSQNDDGSYVLMYSLSGLTHLELPDESINLILAASNNGYYEIDAASAVSSSSIINPELGTSNLTERIQYSSIELSKIVLNSFFVDYDPLSGDEDSAYVFALGYKSGLWKNSVKNGIRFWDNE